MGLFFKRDNKYEVIEYSYEKIIKILDEAVSSSFNHKRSIALISCSEILRDIILIRQTKYKKFDLNTRCESKIKRNGNVLKTIGDLEDYAILKLRNIAYSNKVDFLINETLNGNYRHKYDDLDEHMVRSHITKRFKNI